MKTARINRPTPLSLALHALKTAILEGATWRYEQLVSVAVKAGATEEQIDLVAHEAIWGQLESWGGNGLTLNFQRQTLDVQLGNEEDGQEGDNRVENPRAH